MTVLYRLFARSAGPSRPPASGRWRLRAHAALVAEPTEHAYVDFRMAARRSARPTRYRPPHPQPPPSPLTTRSCPSSTCSACVRRVAVGLAAAAAGCGGGTTADIVTRPPPAEATIARCSVADTLRLAVAQTARVDCSNGGTTVTVAGAGASYLVVPQFATDQGADYAVSYTLSTANAAAAASTPSAAPAPAGSLDGATRSSMHPNPRQAAFDGALRADGARMAAAGAFRSASVRANAARAAASVAPPPVGSVRTFHVRSSLSSASATWKTVAAQLRHVGGSVLLYIDTLAPLPGLSDAQVQQFGAYFDQTLYPIDTAAFGQPSDVDQNGRVIMLMSPVVNADTPRLSCVTLGYVLGFFDPVDFDGSSDENSNHGEVFYSIVPDPGAKVSCAHTVGDVMASTPATFLHELQHLISFSRHVVLGGGVPQQGWLDEGMSIAAEELGSLYYENRCPPPACRHDASQLFPDSSQGFVNGFVYDSYQYALGPDAASVTLHSDADNGFDWRGGDWALVHWLGDQYGTSIYRKLENSSSVGVAGIEAASGQSFPILFADFGLALYTDSLSGLPRATAPSADRFLTRNLRQLWARLFTTSGASAEIPYAMPLQLKPITSDTTPAGMPPGAGAFYRLDTPASASAVTLHFSAPGSRALTPSLRPQLAIFRLPDGQ